MTFHIVPYFFIDSTKLLGFLKTWKEGAKAAYIGNFVFNLSMFPSQPRPTKSEECFYYNIFQRFCHTDDYF